jgi:NHLM bacteriocin system ABC transporter peptidase/ATP-binding protein
MMSLWNRLRQGLMRPVANRRVKTPTVLQMEAVECGAASLCTVLAYHGRWVPLEELRYACGVSRDGSKASNLVQAARNFGLKAKGFKMETAELRQLPLPMIVFWNFNHFLVVEGFGADKIYLNDPATGPRQVGMAEFDERYTGVVLAFEPGPEFVRGGAPDGIWSSLKSRLPGTQTSLLFLCLASIALTIPGLMLPAFTRTFIDYYLIQQATSWLWPLLAAMAGAAVLRVVLTHWRGTHLLRLQTRLAAAPASRFFWHVLRLPSGFFAQRYGGEIASRTGLNDRVAMLIAGDLAQALFNLISTLIFGALLLQYDLGLAILGFAFATGNAVALVLVARSLNDANQKLLQDRGKLNGAVTQGIGIMDSFKASGMEDLFFQRVVGFHAKVVSAEQAQASLRLRLQVLPVVLGGLSSAAVLTLGGMRVMEGSLSIGMLIAFQMLMTQFQTPVNALVGLSAQFQEAEGYIKRLDDVLRHPQDAEFEQPTDAPLQRLRGEIRVEHLRFGFSPLAAPLIDDFSLHVMPGQRVALVGGSGSGKSTVGKLLAGLYQPWSGEILFDGQALTRLGRETLRTSLAVVDQEIALFEGTIKDNLTLWDRTIADERVIQAARDACIHDAITARSEAYDSPVSEGGRNFSGGQRQRLEIARALATDPSILIFDEATSALDAETEVQVMNHLRQRGCTCLIIAHRLSSIRDCDLIVVLDRGRAVEQGTHDSLMQQNGLYRQLIES